MPVSRSKRRKKHSGKNSLQRSAGSIVQERVKKLGDFELLSQLPDVEKMSQVILDFAKPLTEVLDNNDDEAFISAIGTAVIIWNTCLLPEDERESVLREMLDEVKGAYPESRKDFLDIVDVLLQRKMKYFPDNKRFIVDFEVQTSKKSRNLSVVSTLDKNAARGIAKSQVLRRSGKKKVLIFLILAILVAAALYFFFK